MKINLTMILLALMIGVPVLAQNEGATFEGLTTKLSSAKNFEEVGQFLKEAKKLYSKNAKQAGDDKDQVAKEMLGFALFRKAVLLRINPDGRNGFIPKGGGKEFLKFYVENVEELVKLFEDTIEIFEKDLEIETIQLATAKFELARSSESNFLDKSASADWDEHLKKYARNQELYLDAFLIRERLHGGLDDMVLVTAFYLANSYVRSSNFENALIYYDKYVEGYREKYGRNSENLLPALYMTGSIWRLVGSDEAVNRISKEISEITKKETDFSDSLLLLSPRSKSFKHKGINPVRASMTHQNPTGVTSSGEVVNADSMSTNNIRGREGSSATASILLNEGRSSLKVSKIIKVFVKVDTKGNVAWLKAEEEDSKIKEKIESRVRKWKFKPFIFKDKPMTMNGFVNYYDLRVANL